MPNSLQQSKQTGFTLIEILVTVSLTALIMMGITSLFITFIMQAGKSRISQSVRENGTVAMQKMIEELRNAKNVGSVTYPCDGNARNRIDFVNANQIISYLSENTTLDRIELNVDGTLYYLTSDLNANDNLRLLYFTCYPTDSGKYVDISYTLSTSNDVLSTSNSLLKFQSGISLRN